MNTYYCSPEELLENSRIPLRIKKTESEIYEEISEIMINTILEHQGQKTVFICPVGPIAQYDLFVRKINEQNISLKNVWFINMDEYLNENDCWIDENSPLSFRGFMNRNVYSRIRPELVMPLNQRVFPDPHDINKVDRLLEELGGADCSLTGVGINGHIAFNEPPNICECISDEEYANLPTRCLDLSNETIVNNGAHKIKGALDIMPRRCITIGMKQLLAVRKIKIYLYCDWQWGIMRKVSLEPVTRFAPASFLQLHKDSEMVITEKLLNSSI